jgi:hypothetical protein
MALLDITSDPTFLKPLYDRSDSQETLVETTQFNSLPTEIIILIAMSSGFHGCMNLRKTNRRLRYILNDKRNWRRFVDRTGDTIETHVTIETRLHQFDQIIFGEWNVHGTVPCIIHRTFLEQYDFLGGVSLIQHPNGQVKASFFEQRNRLLCFDAPGHSCSDCSQYDTQVILKTEFVHKSLSGGESLSFVYRYPKRSIHVFVQEMDGVFGYSNDVPGLTTRIHAINGKPLKRLEKAMYMKYVL